MTQAKTKPRAKGKAASFANLLDQICDFISQYVFCTESQRVAIALWIIHTHTIEAADATPYLAVTSAEKRSGKSRLFEVMSLVVARPWIAVEPSDAVLFRKIQKDRPTLLLDETDAIFGPNTPSRETLRGILNAGNRRGATVPRCVGEGSKMEVVDFEVFCAKAFAGIGRLPDTIADRSIRIRLTRRKTNEPTEQIKPYRPRVAKPQAIPLKRRIEQWSSTHIAQLTGAEPVGPDGLSDRAVEGWEPLWAIADLAGGEWPERVRQASIELAAALSGQEPSAQLLLLEDIRTVFTELGTPRLLTARLLRELTGISESPWREWKGNGLNAHTLGRLLSEYEIRSTAWRTKSGSRRGYLIDQFQDAFERFLPPLP